MENSAVTLESCITQSDEKQPTPDTVLLMELEENDLLLSKIEFDCAICLDKVEIGEGVILRECFHQFCRTCLTKHIEYSEAVTITCPHRGENFSCTLEISIREIKVLVPTSYQSLLQRSLHQAEMTMKNAYHCKTADCTAWWELEPDTRKDAGFRHLVKWFRSKSTYKCPICCKKNCLKCQAMHESVSCITYQRVLQQDQMDIQTKQLIQSKVNDGIVMKCPSCRIMVEKTGGCVHMWCSFCKTDFDWISQENQRKSGDDDGTLFVPMATRVLLSRKVQMCGFLVLCFLISVIGVIVLNYIDKYFR
ncbi:ranBP-type and C3HC4-type zinc finger-containing protein 1 [Folsomia candida]|uniref:ranBP-type and C3HC4-type zinc finger-containing protein 1 n=1 Tax=Folsomia candida TaxID=158441 RepID=UPI000B8FC9FC|nr:ranBP-type and C3HC4-type zinc finger-containing protein 1 [Folsomia candida]